MATLETIRTRAGVLISVIIGIALLSFIINPDSLQQASMLFSSKYDAGEIAGKSISYQDYQERVDYHTAMYELNMGGRANMNDQVTEQLREQAWQDFIREYVMYKEFEKVGVTVSDAELIDMTTGSDPAQMIRQIFTNRETGEFDRARLIYIIQNLDADPAIKAQWISIENQIKDERLYNKFSTLLTKSSFFNSIDLKEAIANDANNVEFAYVVKPYLLNDTTANVSDSELKNYYNKHKYLYNQTRSRDVSYIAIPINPSADDYLLAMENMQKLEKDFISTPVAELSMFVNRNSEKAFDDIYYKKGDLSEVLDTFAFNDDLGSFLPIYQEGDTYNMARISGIRNLPDTVRARHILLSPENEGKADSIITALKSGADFAALANEFSIDNAANQKGGDLGWFSFREMVRPFSDSAFYSSKGKILKVRTQFGQHILEILDKGPESKHVQVATIQYSVTPGKITSQTLYNEAKAIAVQADNKKDKFEQLAAEKGLVIQYAPNIALNAKRVMNFTNARELVRWMYQANIGEVSDVFEIDNNAFVVATLTQVREEGTAPFEQVKGQIEIAVKKEKQAGAIAEQFKTAMGSANNSIDNFATQAALQVVNVSTAINFNTSYISGIISQEPSLVGAVTSTAENKLAGPIKGENGVYVYTVTNKTVKDVNPEDEKARLTNSLSMRAYEYYTILIEKANIVDNRGNFY